MARGKEKSLLEALEEYTGQGIRPFHTPGHKQGRWSSIALREALGQALRLDLTEVEGLDDLAAPAGVIRDAQKRAARLFGAGETLFLVNGSTAGIQAAFLALAKSGEDGVAGPAGKVLMPRYSHRAAFAALILSGLEPDFIPAAWSGDGVALGFYGQDVVRKLAKAGTVAIGNGAIDNGKIDNDEIYAGGQPYRAVYLTAPTYFGVEADIREVVDAAHRKQVAVVVDEAHGPHFIFHDKFPSPALAQGADVVIQSAHKFLPVLTQASLLQVGKAFKGRERIAANLRLLQTSSPSYLLMASLDEACLLLEEKGKQLYSELLERVDQLRDALGRIAGIALLEEKDIPGFRLDPTKIVIDVSALGLTGFDAALWVRENYRLQAEMADFKRVLFLLTPGDGPDEITLLLRAVEHLAAHYQPMAGRRKNQTDIPAEPPPLGDRLGALPRTAWQAGHKEVPLEEAVGEVAGEFVTLSPPGVPLVFPGELISPEIIDYIKMLRQIQGKVKGFTAPCGETIKVVC